ncbi:UNVERIFIED_CONTAM: hypothetical protein PYX00_004852 [Menopon gallinae]|uniref:Phosphatidylinositol-3-phosphatase SAC1 n=1 Tax=Menopon gallinae TaxID=328185 RepID=A0AAW2I7E9_9NEOP
MEIKMDDVPDLYSEIILYVTPDKFYLGSKASPDGIVCIDRVTEEFQFNLHRCDIPETATHKHIVGVLGTIRLIAGNYLIVVTGRKKIGTINGQSIWMVTSTEIISYSKTYLHLNEKQMSENRTYLNMVESVLQTPYFYFSYTYDLTHTLQRLQHTPPEFLKLSLHERADERFLWNNHLLKEFTNYKELSRFCLSLLHGFISINNISVNGNCFTWTVISRRSTQRVGARLFCRGTDHNGNVSNFVETEQIVECGLNKASFVQTRGSIPLFWHQLPTLKYKPKPKLIVTDLHSEAFQRHMSSQIFHYGKLVLVNLIDQHGSEFELEKAYRQHAETLNQRCVRYEGFDFHRECRRMRYDRLSILIDRIAHEQDEFGYFLRNSEGTIVSDQEGVFRTNCIDCLDRTNVVQSLLARRNLTAVLQKMRILRPDQRVEDQPGLEELFKNIWADNADVLSIEYSGTPALKTDFTRTGKRTRMGALRDGINSLTRYYKNNFSDGFRQDALDLFVGNYIVKDGEGVSIICPLDRKKGWKYITFPLVLLIAISMFFANVITPSEYNTETLLYLLFWGSMVAGTLATIFNYGTEFVDYPKLLEK